MGEILMIKYLKIYVFIYFNTEFFSNNLEIL